MNKVLNEDQQYELINFIGYGRLDADIWFLEYEETLSVPVNLSARLKYEQVENLTEAKDPSAASAKQESIDLLPANWRGFCEVMLRLEGNAPTPANIRNYFDNRLGLDNGATLLAYFMPIPMQAGTDWPYEDMMPKYPSREVYLKKVKPLRIDFFHELIGQYAPKVIVSTGREYWPEYQKLFHGYKLAPNGDFMIGWDSDTVVILADDFSTPGAMENIPALVNLIKENSLAIDTEKYNGPIRLSQAEMARQKKDAARKAMQAKRKSTAKHNPADPYCVCEFCLGYEND